MEKIGCARCVLTNKDPLVLCVGARRYVVNPVYSQHVRGGGKGVNNVHKSEKFLRAGSAVVATCFGPITFGKSGVVLLKDEGADQGMSFCNPARLPVSWSTLIPLA